MAKRQNGFKGGKVIGTLTGEPNSKPSPARVGPAKGGNFFQNIINRGAKAVRPNPSQTATPRAFKGGKQIVDYPNSKRVKGTGANKGAGTTSHTTDP